MTPQILTRCLNPKRIVNPYTHEVMLARCGHCEACALQRNNHLALLCDLEAQSHRYCMFITLTYANRFIPRAQFVDCIDRPFGCDLISTDGELLTNCDMSEEERAKYLEKFYLFGFVPYLRKSDLQKFFKRFRFYAKKISADKVRYFACGEYGPHHFRPHFHILLFFDDTTLLQACEQIVLQAWPFGRCDVQISRGNCSSYVASYVNSSVFVPKVFKARTVAPFCVHSQKLGQTILSREREEVYSLTARDFVKRCLVINGKYREFNLWRSYYAAYFPKCRGYSDKSPHERAFSYRLYDYARQVFPTADTALETARQIAACITVFYRPEEQSVSFTDKLTLDLCRYFYDSSVGVFGSDSYDHWVHRIYTELLLSKHFLTFVCNSLSTYEINRKLKIIDEFYKQLEYMHLTDFFEVQSAFFDSDLIGTEDFSEGDFYPYFYNNVNFNLADYKATPAFRVMSAKTLEEFKSRGKHKLLNDINRLLFNE